jgi:hypothetical protein
MQSFRTLWSSRRRAVALAGVLASAACASGELQEGLGPQSESMDSTVAVSGSDAAVNIQGLTLSPTSATLAPGASKQFNAIGWINGYSSPAPNTVWGAEGGTITQSGLYTAGSKAGTYRIAVKSFPTGHAEVATVIISGSAPSSPNATVSAILVTPGERTTVYKGATQQYTAAARLSDGTTQPNASVSWSATGGTISSTGAYKAGQTSGYFRVIARSSNGKADTSEVTIPTTASTIASVVVTPASASLAAGAAQQFTASAKLSNGSTQSNPSVTWSATGGTVTSAGRFTAGSSAGNFRVIARSSNGKADTSTVAVTAGSTPTVTAVNLTPANVSLAAGAKQTFSTQVTYSNGTTQTNPSLTWTATGGSMGSGQVYTAGTSAGTYRVIASANGRADTSVVTIAGSSTPPPSGPNAMYFNSAEAGCGSDGNVLLCDDFEDGDWYSKNCDQANSSGGLLQTDGWCGTIYGPTTPAMCSGQGFRSNCAASHGTSTGAQGNVTMADHSLSQASSDVYVRFYTKTMPGYRYGAEKVLAFNKGQAGVGGIYFGNLHINCGGGGGSSTGRLQWQPTGGETGCRDIITMTPGNWYFIEIHMNTATGVLQIWADDCGSGSGCTGTPTLRVNLSGYRLPSGSVGSLWFENWANPGSAGTRVIDQVKVARSQVGFMR